MSSVQPLVSEASFDSRLRETLDAYREVIPYRSDLLFTRFLPTGYRMTTLSCVEERFLFRVLFIKCNLGMFITLLDDFADNPELRNKELLAQLYRVPFDDEFIDLSQCSVIESKICQLALRLRANMKEHILELPGFLPYYDVFKFDFEQILRANQYSELMTDFPDIINPAECRQYGAYNMGMVLAGMIDLMTSSKLADPLGVLRQIFIAGQRHGRLSNVISTMNRERKEEDNTNELVGLASFHGTSIASQQARAENEMADVVRKLEAVRIEHFDLPRYVQSLRDLHHLHMSMVGTI